jgi:hypothetical protein
MEMMTSGWTDERMDDLKGQVDDLGRRMDAGFRGLREDMDAGFRGLREEMATYQRETNTRIDSLQRTMIQFGGVMVAALVGLIATQLGLILTQL